MPVQHVNVKPVGQRPDLERGGEIGPPEHARHGQPVDAEAGKGGQGGEALLRQPVGREAVGEDADLVAARAQRLRQVADMAEQPADGGPQHLQDMQRLAGARRRRDVICRHNQRSPITTVSPGWIGSSRPTLALIMSPPTRR